MILNALNAEKTTAFLIGVLLMVYLSLRAIYTPLLHDEIATFFYFIQTNDYIPPYAHWDANNHLLNSFLGSLSFQMFGDAPWALRLPNVLFFALYLFFSWKTAEKLRHIWLKWCVFLSVVCISYIFEYFALCRGYGMSLGLLISGIFFFISAFESQIKWMLYLSMTLLFLAVSANLTLIYIYLILAMLSTITMWLLPVKTKILKTLHTASILVYSLLIISPLLYFSFELKSRGALYYGGDDFINYTIKPLLKLITTDDSLWIIILVTLIFGLTVFLSFHQFIQDLKKKKYDPRFIFSALILGSLVAIFSTHYLLGVNYPEDRTAMYLVPLFILSFGFAIDGLNRNLILLSSFPLLIFPIYFFNHLRVDEALFSIEERNVQEYFDFIEKEGKNKTQKPTIGGYATQSFCWYYMNYRNGGKQNALLYSGHPDTICDFQIVNEHVDLDLDFTSRYNKLNKRSVHHLDLYQRKNELTRELISNVQKVTNWNHSNNEFFNLHEIAVTPNWQGKALLINITGIIHSPNKPFYATISASQKDSTWSELGQERVVLNWLRYDWSDDTKQFHQTLILPNISKNAAHIQVFIWNIKSKSFLVKDCQVDIYLLQ